MQPLPPEFLTEIADQKKLSPKQQKAFVEADNSNPIVLENFIQQQSSQEEVTATEAKELLKSGRGLILLAQIAEITFTEGNYFFKQRDAEEYIADYIRNLSDAKTDPEALLLDSEAVLKSIQAQHGLLVERAKKIFSFSHLTFHEYFTARQIVARGEKALPNFVSHISHITEKRWREVFLLTVEMQTNADALLKLMKQQIDGLVAEDEKIQKYLQWAEEKVRSIDTKLTPAKTRKLYLNRDLDLDHFLHFNRDPDLDLDHFLNLDLDHFLHFNRDPDLDLDQDLYVYLSFNFYNFNLYINFDHYFNHNLDYKKTKELITQLSLESEFSQRLNILIAQLLNLQEDKEQIKQWWHTHGSNWITEYRSLIIKYRNIGHEWNFNQQQQDLIKQYLEANKLLEECLEGECYVSRAVREEIEASLYLPSRND